MADRVVGTLRSKVFPSQELSFLGCDNLKIPPSIETIVKGEAPSRMLLHEAFRGINQIGLIGWGSQGPAQAQNLRESLKSIGSDIVVKVGLRPDSSSAQKARGAGFTEENGTLGEMLEVIRESDFVIILISDAAQVEMHEEIFDAMKEGAILGLSHGFLLGYLENQGKCFPEKISVVMVAPKGMGPSVRRLYEQGSGINASFTVHQVAVKKNTPTCNPLEVAIGWAVALGAPTIFETTMESEYKSDIFGERGILLGAVHGLIEFLFKEFKRFTSYGYEECFRQSAECITGSLSRMISAHGLLAVYESSNDEDKILFEKTYSEVYPVAMEILREIYDEVSSGNEIWSVIMAGDRLKDRPMGKIDGTLTWNVGEVVRAIRDENNQEVRNPVTEGAYIAVMMAQIDLLLEKGHPVTEVANETVIEAVDSLNPYMHYKGVAYMIDNCSTTARLGARKWAPRFDYLLTQQVKLPFVRDGVKINENLIQQFRDHMIHDALQTCRSLRPEINIALV